LNLSDQTARERLIYNALATADCVTVTPRLNTPLRNGIALRKTVKLLINFGAVNRGVCEVKDSMLTDVVETYNIRRENDGKVYSGKEEVLFPKLFRINASLYKLCDIGFNGWLIFFICNAEPLIVSFQKLAVCNTCFYHYIDTRREEKLRCQAVFIFKRL